MDIAIVTGASSSLGQAISKRLIELGFRVYGLGGDYADCPLQNVNFRPVSCDLSNADAIEKACQQIMEKEKGVYVVINNAKFFGQKAFMEMDAAEIERILRINLLCPLILTRFFANSLKSLQGFLIQLGAPYSDACRGGAAGAAASGGLKWMGDQLFNELRVHGVKVCHLSPEPNRIREAHRQLRPGARMEASIDPEAVAQAVEQILRSPFGNVVTELVLRPLRIDEPVHDPVVKIPYPEPQPIPYTVPREFIEAEEQLDEEDWKEKQQQKRKRRATKKAARKRAQQPTEKKETAPAEAKKDQKETQPQPEKGESQKSRRRPRRKPRPPKVEVGFHQSPDTEKAETKPEKKDSESKDTAPAEKSSGGKKRARKTAAKKTAGKKAAAKTARKAAKKPTPRKAAKKAVRKTATKAAQKQPRKSAKKPSDSTDNGNNSAK